MTVRLYDGLGRFLNLLPQAQTVNVQDVLNEEGSGTLTYPAHGKNAELLAQLGQTTELADCMAGVFLDGEEVFRFLLDEDEGNEADEAAQARQVTLGGSGTLGLLARGVVLPGDGIGSVPATHKFVDRNAGSIMLTLLDAMKRLGYLTQIEVSFTSTRDSAGNPWDTWIDVEYDAGKDLLTVVKDLAVQGCCDVRMRGLTLDLFNPNTTLAQEKPGIYVRRVHAQSAPRRRSRRNLRTDYLIVGDEGVNALRFDNEARERFGRRIGFIGQGDTVTAASLYRVGDEALKENARPTTGYTLDLRLGAKGCPQPYRDFRLGDFIRSDFATAQDGTYEPLRVKAITVGFGEENGTTTCSLEVNDRFAEAILDLTRKVEGIRHGKVSGTSRPPSEPPPGKDLTIPAPPVAIRTRGQLSYSAEGNQTATMEVSWPPVVANANDGGSALEDLDHYEVRFKFVDRVVVDPQDPGGGGETGPEEPAAPKEYELVEEWRDNFDRPNAANVWNGWIENGGDWTIRGLKAHTFYGNAVLLRPFKVLRDFRVDADLDSNDGLGTPAVVVRGNPNVGIGAGYVALYSATNLGSNVELRKDGRPVRAVHHGPTGNFLGIGQHTLSVEMRGKTIHVYIDGNLALSWADPDPLPKGEYVGIGTIGKVATACDSFVISEFFEVTPTAAGPLGADLDGDGVEDAPVVDETDFIDPEYTSVGTTDETGILITGLPTATKVQVEVRAADKSGNKSDWTIAEVFLTPGDDAAPPAPATPTVTPRLGGIEVTWPMATFDGGALPPDYHEVEVYAGSTSTFVPLTSNRLGSLIGGTGFFTSLPYGAPVYVKLVLVDHVGNRSVPSAPGSATPRPLVNAEIGLAEILGRNLANGSVNSDKLTVGVLHDGMLLNPGFEELTDSGLSVAWEFGPSTTGSYAIDETLPKEGERSVRMRPSNTTSSAYIRTRPYYPVTENEWYYASAWWKGSVGTAFTRIAWYDDNKGRLTTATAGAAVALSAAWKNGLGLVRAPEGARFARMELLAGLDAINTDVWVDGADLRLATGSANIVDASIGSAQIADLAVNRAKIGLLAVGEAQISSLTVNKLVAGELSATYVTVTGRLTSKAGGLQTGARWELDQDSFRSYKADGSQSIRIGSEGAIEVIGGTIRAGLIDGAQVTGGIITSPLLRTAPSGPRIELNSATAEDRTRIRFFGGYASDGMDVGSNPAVISVIDSTMSTGQVGPGLTLRVPGTSVRAPVDVLMNGDGFNVYTGIGPRLPTDPDQRNFLLFGQTGMRIKAPYARFQCQLESTVGVFDEGFRVYSPSNPPPAIDFRGRQIGGSSLNGSPLFMLTEGDYNTRINHSASFGGGPQIIGYGSVQIHVLTFHAGTPAAYANSRGEWTVATKVFANGVQLSSSREHKNQIEPLGDDSLSRLRRLRPVRFDRMNDSSGRELRRGPEQEVGLIAEEVAEVCPEVSPDGTSVDLMALTSLLVKSVQELTAQVDALRGPART